MVNAFSIYSFLVAGTYTVITHVDPKHRREVGGAFREAALSSVASGFGCAFNHRDRAVKSAAKWRPGLGGTSGGIATSCPKLPIFLYCNALRGGREQCWVASRFFDYVIKLSGSGQHDSALQQHISRGPHNPGLCGCRVRK